MIVSFFLKDELNKKDLSLDENVNNAIINSKDIQLEEAYVTKIVDGDTIWVKLGNTEEKVRLIGIDCPEYTKQIEPYGKEATEYTTEKLLNKMVFLQKDVSNTDNYDRLLRYVWTEKIYDMNDNQIAEYKSAREAWKQTGISDTTIGLVCKGKGKTAGGFIWRYKNTSKVFKLCYIDTNCAYFTNDFEHQWGDDFNDAPYEHNAGEPYHSYSELIEDNADLFKRIYIHLPIQIKKIYFELPYWGYLPCDGFVNSPYSVEDINKKAVAWIHTEDFNILAETTLEDFKKIIKKYGGSIYVKED